MRRLTLKPYEVKRFGVGSDKWLIVREAQEYVYIQDDNGTQIRIESGDKLDISSFKELEIYNPHTVDIRLVVQLTKVDLKTTPPTNVKFADSIAISEVRSPVKTREEAAQRFVSPAHIVIDPNKRARLVRQSFTRIETIIQNISDTETEVMIGDALVSAVAGMPVLGDRTAPAGITLTGGGEIWAYNNSNQALKLAVLEVHR